MPSVRTWVRGLRVVVVLEWVGTVALCTYITWAGCAATGCACASDVHTTRGTDSGGDSLGAPSRRDLGLMGSGASMPANQPEDDAADADTMQQTKPPPGVACGDGVVSSTEECDCGPDDDWCEGGDCVGHMAPDGTYYHGGRMLCDGMRCRLDKNGCEWCGDGTINGPGSEVCDGADLGGVTCEVLGFNGGGELRCTDLCVYNYEGCTTIMCGDGICSQAKEDSCSCPKDCPDDPGTCSPCECGGVGGGGICSCDALCMKYGDCCVNGPC